MNLPEHHNTIKFSMNYVYYLTQQKLETLSSKTLLPAHCLTSTTDIVALVEEKNIYDKNFLFV